MQKINNWITYLSIGFILLTTQLGLAIEDNEKINIPEPKCFIERSCLIKYSKCFYTGDTSSYFTARSYIKIKKYNLCVAYNGVIAKFTTEETANYYDTFRDERAAKMSCEDYLDRIKNFYDTCR